MATLALGFVGQAVGASIGGSILGITAAQIGGYVGATIGGLIDNRLFPQRVEGPRLNDLSVTASTYGVAIARAYGPSVRLSGNIIWSSGLIETSSRTRTGGKGGGGVVQTNYSYHAHLAVALSAGQIAGLKRIWANGKVIFQDNASGAGTEPTVWDRAGGAISVANEVRFYPGSLTQGPDSLIESYLGAGDVPGYIDTCYVVFDTLQLADFGNRIPNLEFEIEAHAAIDAADVVRDICTKAGVTFPSLAAIANIPIDGYVIGRATSAWGGIQPLALAGSFDLADRGGQISAINRGTAPCATIPSEDLAAVSLAGDGGSGRQDRFKFDRAEDRRLPRRATVTYRDPTLDYQANSQHSERELGASENDLTTELPLNLAPADAAKIADRLLHEAWAGRIGGPVRLTDRWHWLEAGRTLAVPAAGGLMMARIERVTRSPNGLVDVELKSEDPEVYRSTAVGQAGVLPPNVLTLPGDTRLQLIDAPILLDANDDDGFYFAATGEAAGWRGGVVERSIDAGGSYDVVASAGIVVDMGDVAGTVPTGPEDVWDRGSVLTVSVEPGGVLESRTEFEVLAGANLAWVGPADGQGGEYIQFQTATLVSPGTYQLSTLLRGRKGTEHAIGTHASGDVFVLMLGGTVQRRDYGVGDWSRSRLYRAVTLYQDPTTAATQAFANTGEGKRPLAPAHPRGVKDGSGDLTLSWVRRTRLSVPGLGRGPVPLGEQSEAYEVDIDVGGSVVRTIAAATPQITYSAADQAADGFAGAQPITGTIYQLSGSRGRGRGRSFAIGRALPPLPTSTTRFWGPQDMTFNGSGELTGITDQVAASSAYISIQGAPTGDTSTGIQMTEANGIANHIRLGSDVWWSNPGRHMAFLVRRNGTADTLVMALANAGAPGSIYVFAADGSASADVFKNFSVTAVRSAGAESLPATRDALWDVAFNDSAWRVVMFKDVVHAAANAGTIVQLFAGSGATTCWEGDYAGFGEFTDWAEADDMEAALLARAFG